MSDTLNYYQLPVGFEFPEQKYFLDKQRVLKYLQATKETHTLFQVDNFVPPAAIAALAISSLSGKNGLPFGTLHVSQELEFFHPVKIGDTISCNSKLIRNVHRGGLHLMSAEVTAFNQKQDKVLVGKVGLVLPEPENQ